MTLKTRLAKIERNHKKETPKYKEVKPERYVYLAVKYCAERYRFSEAEVRKRLKHEIDELMAVTTHTYREKTNVKKIPRQEAQARISELMDKSYLKYFTDTTNPEIPRSRLERAQEDADHDKTVNAFYARVDFKHT